MAFAESWKFLRSNLMFSMFRGATVEVNPESKLGSIEGDSPAYRNSSSYRDVPAAALPCGPANASIAL
jgi:hypothetical protein